MYNPRGQVLTAQSPEVSYSYTYDAALRLASVNDSRGNKTIAYQYSPGGRLTRTTIDDVGPIDYRYDSTGQLTKGWPLGSERFKCEIEAALERAARPPKRGRPKRPARLGTEVAEM